MAAAPRRLQARAPPALAPCASGAAQAGARVQGPWGRVGASVGPPGMVLAVRHWALPGGQQRRPWPAEAAAAPWSTAGRPRPCKRIAPRRPLPWGRCSPAHRAHTGRASTGEAPADASTAFPSPSAGRGGPAHSTPAAMASFAALIAFTCAMACMYALWARGSARPGCDLGPPPQLGAHALAERARIADVTEGVRHAHLQAPMARRAPVGGAPCRRERRAAGGCLAQPSCLACSKLAVFLISSICQGVSCFHPCSLSRARARHAASLVWRSRSQRAPSHPSLDRQRSRSLRLCVAVLLFQHCQAAAH